MAVAHALLACSLLSACLEKPDPASQAAAILHKHPSSLLDKVAALDALASRELGLEARPILAESLHAYALRLGPALSAAGDPAPPEDSAREDSPGGSRTVVGRSRAEILNAFVFDTLGITPLLDDTSLASSLPSRVLLDRRGSCVGLVLLYLALGEQLNLPLAPIFLPGHIALRWAGDSKDVGRNVETLRRGLARSDSFYLDTFALRKRPWYTLEAARPEQALGALVFNLGNFHRSQGNWAAALEEYRLAEEILPGYPEALGSQGAGHLAAGDRAAAKVKLEASLAGDSLAAPVWQNLKILYRAEGDSAKTHWAQGYLEPASSR